MMNKLFLPVALCALGMAACSQLRTPDDTQLATLLGAQNTSPADADAPLDSRVIDCLRAWSGDADLLKGLSVRFAGEDGKKTCRTTLDERVADSGRNPDAFTFEEISAPKVVRRAMDLQEARRLAALAAISHAPPPKMPPAAPPREVAAPDPNVDLGVAGTRLKEAETLCLQAQQAATAPDAADALKRFSAYCSGSLRKLRSNLEASARRGRTQEQLQTMADSADRIADVARNLLAAPQ